MSCVLLFKGKTQYGALNVFIDHLANAIEGMGTTPVVVDRNAADGGAGLIAEAFQSDCEFALGFNAIGSDLISNERSAYAQAGVPFVSVMVDHPVHHFQWYHENHARDDVLLAFADRDHIRYVKRFFSDVNAVFLPQAACAPTIPKPALPDWKRRRTDVLFIGSMSDFNATRRQWLEFPPVIAALFDEVAEITLSGPGAALDLAFSEALARRGLHPSDRRLCRFMNYMGLLDDYSRSRRRFDCLSSLVATDLNVECVTNWTSVPLPRKPTVTIRGPVEMTQACEFMRRSKCVVNLLPNYLDGAHERLFSAMVSGALVATEPSVYLREEFVDGESVVYFERGETDELASRLTLLRDAPAEALRIALAGRSLTSKRHQWRNRVEALVKNVELHKLMRLNDQKLPFKLV